MAESWPLPPGGREEQNGPRDVDFDGIGAGRIFFRFLSGAGQSVGDRWRILAEHLRNGDDMNQEKGQETPVAMERKGPSFARAAVSSEANASEFVSVEVWALFNFDHTTGMHGLTMTVECGRQSTARVQSHKKASVVRSGIARAEVHRS